MSARVLREGRVRLWLEPEDRGLAYGDGVFETLLVHRGPAGVVAGALAAAAARRATARPAGAGRNRSAARVHRACCPAAGAGAEDRADARQRRTRLPAAADATPTVVLSTHPAPEPPARGCTCAGRAPRWRRSRRWPGSST
jgi:branched-subunit amino acid aminotransferase/4-amino-4-deoxychorismate lyase